ncbi:MAG: ATP-dependent DNA helicase RecG [Patescibacteria group bacterium]
MKLTLDTEIERLPRVGLAISKKLHHLDIRTVADLLQYYPFRYDDFSRIVPIVQIKPDAQCTIRARINLIANKRAWRRRMYVTECLVSDDTASLKIVWFNQPFITKLLAQGDTVYFSGKAEYTPYGLQLQNPAYEKIKKEQTHTARIVPVYSLTANLTEKQIRFLIKLVLPLANRIPDWLPKDISGKFRLISLPQAIREIHFPTNHRTLAQAVHRLKFNELFLIQLRTQSIRQSLSKKTAPRIPFDREATRAFVAELPFTLTNSQKKSAWRILQDINQDIPMNRLLEGDVGSGKTVVAAMAMLNAANSGYQSALMAPTEILAQQHYQTLTQLFKKSKISLGLLTRTDKKIEGQTIAQSQMVRKISRGTVKILVGTHALIQKKISFKNLGLVIIDEQHRFGVDQRRSLKQRTMNNEPRTVNHIVHSSKSKVQSLIPHLLSMTATPIPRSLALTLYGDLDVSMITESPAGRKKILTKIVPPEKRHLAYDFIRAEIGQGRQIFVICPLIDESDKLGVKSATVEYEKLKQGVFSDLTIGLLHGKLRSKDKEQVMKKFTSNEIDILVATAVVEVGVDVPNASVMMIEGAERFGLAQLHQFRGRVGRAAHQSYCFVFTDSDSNKTKDRLDALVTAKNGFELAEKDLAFRGPGEIYGLRQSGFPDLKIAQLTDYELIKLTRQAAQQLFSHDPQLANHPALRQMAEISEKNSHLE